jgi:hypothetical protein
MVILASRHLETPAFRAANNKLARSAAYVLDDIGTSQCPTGAVWIHCIRDGSRLSMVGVRRDRKAEDLIYITDRRP